MEAALELAAGERLRAIAPVVLWDIENIPEALLPWIAQTLDADLWPGDLGGAPLQRLSITDALTIHRLRGTGAALDHFAAAVDASMSWLLTDRSGSTRAGIDVFVNPGPGVVASGLWVQYVTRVIGRLIPGWLRLIAVHILTRGSESAYSVAAGSAWEHRTFEGTIAP